ncbi:MAG TPA: hypothetical protein PK886_01035 [Candidatus Paceibacterota bacterium]|nr:hypothetical protein [Candidatus Paceibacterota bacterium]
MLILYYILPLFNLFSQKTIVIDGDTGNRIAGATITYQYANFADGCGKPQTSTTNSNGVARQQNSAFICAVMASAPGYHLNGENRTSHIMKKIILYKQLNEDIPIEFNRVFKEGEGMDVLTYLKNSNVLQTNSIKTEETDDFTFTKLSSTEVTMQNGMKATNSQEGIARMKFTGDGGVQVISEMPSNHTAGEFYFDMENMRVAPNDGYTQELDIIPGKSYVARLRDGKHYMKFHIFASKNFDTKVDQVCITAFANAEATKSLDFMNTSSTSKFCSDNRDSSDYAKNMTYQKLKEDLSKPILAIKYNANGRSLYDQNGYYYNMNMLNTPDVNLDDIVYGYSFTTTPPTYEEFSKLYTEDYGGGQVGYALKLTHEDKVYNASINIPVFGNGAEISTSHINSVKDLCDLSFKNYDLTKNAQVKYNYDQCILRSFGF